MLTRVAPRPGPTEPPRLAFAIGRRLGGAVDRNRLRRRLRAVFSAAAAEGRVPPGAYLAVAREPAMSASFSQLKGDVTTCLSLFIAENGGVL
jgi:ribonuclease P protein component